MLCGGKEYALHINFVLLIFYFYNELYLRVKCGNVVSMACEYMVAFIPLTKLVGSISPIIDADNLL